MPARVFSSPWILALIALLLLAAECLVFHFSFWVPVHALDLITIVLIPTFFVEAFCIRYQLDLDAHEVLSISIALGFALAALLISRLPFAFDSVFVWLLLAPFNRKSQEWMFRFMAAEDITHKRMTIPSINIRPAAITLWRIAIAVALLFAVYNLQQFHYTSGSGITTRGLFGVDIPFLAGEVHGLRNFGQLRDLHQSAQPWHYHDATYRLLAHFNSSNTIADIAFAAPLAGYTLLALSVFALVLRATKRSGIAWMAVLAWFVASGWAGLDTSSYALSPSFVFGSVLLINIILLLDIAHERNGAARTTLLVIALLLTIALAETKITSFLVIVAALMLMALVHALRRSWRSMIEYALLGIVPLCVLAMISKADPLMPAGNFLVGAPLMGYANHLASMLRMPLSSLNPVTHATLSIKSLLILPYFVFHFLRFVALDPRLIAAAIIILWVRPKSELSFLLAIIIPLGFFLPVLYSPAWYPLALSFYAPLASVQAAVLLVAINWQSVHRNVPRVALAVLFGAAIATGLFQIVLADRARPNTISADFVQAMDSIQAKTPKTALIASHRDAIDPSDHSTYDSYYWYSALSGRAVVSEGAKYGSLLGAVADFDSAKGLHPVRAAYQLLSRRRWDVNLIYTWPDSVQVRATMMGLGAQYMLIDHTNSDSLRCTAKFDTVFSNSAVTLLR